MRWTAEFGGMRVKVVPGGAKQPQIVKPKSVWRLATLCLTICGAHAGSALAQLTEPLLPVPTPPSGPQAPAAPGQPVYAGQTVIQRPRPELDPLGLHIGDFFWFPRADFEEAFNSNIFATSTLKTSDFITTLQPAFDLLSSFPRHAFNLRAGAASQFYAEHPAQNTYDGFAAMEGRLDVSRLSAFSATAQAAHLHISRTSPDSPGNAAEPVTYNAYSAIGRYTQYGLRFGYQAEVAIQNTQYNAVPLVGGGILPQRSQDLTFSQAALRASYEIVPDYLGYVRVSGNLSEYQHPSPGAINSNGYRSDFGLQILPRHILSGEVYFGYFSQLYRIGGSLSGPDFGGRLVYDVTRLTTATFTGLRTIYPSNPSVSSSGGGYVATTVTGSVDHELLRNILLNATVGFENDTYQGISRVDTILSTGLGIKYLANRNLYLGGTYTYQQRNSTLAGASYNQSILLVRASTQF
jgi:hypothetical protein